jgi:hypothetical protein
MHTPFNNKMKIVASSILFSLVLASVNGQPVPARTPVRRPVAKTPCKCCQVHPVCHFVQRFLTVTPRIVTAACQPWSQCNLCEVRDCDTDDDCKRNLICAQQHQDQLAKRGLDIRKGRCYNEIPDDYELCIPPKWLVKPKKECEIDWYVMMMIIFLAYIAPHALHFYSSFSHEFLFNIFTTTATKIMTVRKAYCVRKRIVRN